MTSKAVHWFEGMFLLPQHFTTSEHFLQGRIWRGDQWVQHYGWGVRDFRINRDRLSHGWLAVERLQVRLKDGTLVSIPEDGSISDVDLRESFRSSPRLTVFLGCPMIREWSPNVAEPRSDDATRYLRDVEPVNDMNTGGDPRQIDVRRLNVRVLVSPDREPDGYDLIPVARLGRSSESDALPGLDETYIPPLIACDAWEPLQVGILRSAFDRLGVKLATLGSQAESRGITFDTHYQGDAEVLAQIAVLNEAVATLGVVAFAEGIHPLSAYLELCKIAGRLAIFGKSRRVADLPRYDHDDLGGCFFGVKRQLDDLLGRVVEPSYRERPFAGAGMRMQVALEPDWVGSKWRMFIGVRSSLPPEECTDLLTRPGRLDMKVGSSDQVDTIYRLGRAGLQFRPAPYPPRVMPAPPDTVFFQLEPDRQPAEWSAIQRSLTLAIRLNDKLIAGDIRGRTELAIRTDHLSTTIQFTLYAIPDLEAEA